MVLEQLSNIKAVVLDVDGVLTNGSIQVFPDGQQVRTFNVKDGYAMQLAIKRGIHIFVITGAKCEGVLKRMQGLGIKETFLGISDKLHVLDALCDKYELSYTDILFIGDDMPDLIPMQKVAIAACPSDAIEEIKAISAYVSPKGGGQGAVRDVLEKVMKIQFLWNVNQDIKSI